MVSALAVDGQRGPDLPPEFRAPRWDERPGEQRDLESPIPPEWSDRTKELRELGERLREMFEQL
jgi:hypothetical protein